MTINELIGGEVVSVSPNDSLGHAVQTMVDTDVGSVAVRANDYLEGILTERDILRAVAQSTDFDTAQVSDWMTAMPDTLGPDAAVEDAADWMLATGYRHLPVVDDGGQILGMVSIKDVLWALTEPSRS